MSMMGQGQMWGLQEHTSAALVQHYEAGEGLDMPKVC